jgi:hypothetical protein
LSYRQGKRLWRRYRGEGAAGLQHGNCGRASNRGYPAEFRAAVLKRVEERYMDFGPTLASEHLASDDKLVVSAETLRRWLRATGKPGVRKRKAYRRRREPKAHFSELVQMDGSFHDWLEDRGDDACLMHLVDDATSTALFSFSKEETTWAAANLLRREWIELPWRAPGAIYGLEERVRARGHRGRAAEGDRAGEPVRADVRGWGSGMTSHQFPLTPREFRTTLWEWQDSLRVESVTTKSTHFVALPEYPRNSPHRAAWVSSLTPI